MGNFSGSGIESQAGPKDGTKSSVSFTLKDVETSPSQVFQKEDIQKLAAPYLNKTVNLDDLYALVNKINDQYREKGLITCRAFLAPQTIHDGVVRIELVEGTTGQVSIEGNKSTHSDYITSRVHLPQGGLANVKELDKELLRFNVTNDAQLHLSLKAGAAPGTTEKLKSEVGAEYNYQHSQTTFLGNPWVNDRLSTFHLFYDQIDYGRTTVFYQKHGYRFGCYMNISDVSRNYGKYELNTLFQKVFPYGQGWILRLDGQLSSTNYLPSAEMFYLGGLYSVRSYKESLIGGDGGFMASAEYAVPVSKNKKTSAYVFLDGGRVWGSSAFGDRSLVGTDLGIKSDVGSHATIKVALAFPLIRTINDEEQSRTRIHFAFNSTF
ncbi:POTRA domain-containing protein [Megasphaera sp.]|uniref:POTRA domain-containing protein n=1 Tax=Megasphaera sp. TaxID=2023260 RepID=UPI0035213D68